MVNITIYFTNGQTNTAEYVKVEEAMTYIRIVEDEGIYSVAPLANVLFYDVEPA